MLSVLTETLYSTVAVVTWQAAVHLAQATWFMKQQNIKLLESH